MNNESVYLGFNDFKNDENNCFPPFCCYCFVTVLTPCHIILSVVWYVVVTVLFWRQMTILRQKANKTIKMIFIRKWELKKAIQIDMIHSISIHWKYSILRWVLECMSEYRSCMHASLLALLSLLSWWVVYDMYWRPVMDVPCRRQLLPPSVSSVGLDMNTLIFHFPAILWFSWYI